MIHETAADFHPIALVRRVNPFYSFVLFYEQLEQSLDEATQESTLKKLADAKLHRDYEDALALLDRIPKEVLAEYAHGPQPQKGEKKHNR